MRWDVLVQTGRKGERAFCWIPAPQALDYAHPPGGGGAINFAKSLDSNANLIWHLIGTTRNNFPSGQPVASWIHPYNQLSHGGCWAAWSLPSGLRHWLPWLWGMAAAHSLSQGGNASRFSGRSTAASKGSTTGLHGKDRWKGHPSSSFKQKERVTATTNDH